MARTALDGLRDDLYVLACAVEDVERDLAGPEPVSREELLDAVTWLIDAARPLCGHEPSALSPPT